MSLKTNQNLKTYLKWLVFPFSFVKPITSKQKDKFQPKQARMGCGRICHLDCRACARSFHQGEESVPNLTARGCGLCPLSTRGRGLPPLHQRMWSMPGLSTRRCGLCPLSTRGHGPCLASTPESAACGPLSARGHDLCPLSTRGHGLCLTSPPGGVTCP